MKTLITISIAAILFAGTISAAKNFPGVSTAKHLNRTTLSSAALPKVIEYDFAKQAIRKG